MSLTVFPGARKSMSSAKDMAVISGFSCSILLNIPLKYILNKIGDTEDPCETSAQISCSWQIYPSITNCAWRSVKKESIYLTRKPGICSSVSLWSNCCFITQSKAPLTSIKRAPNCCFEFQAFSVVRISVATAFITFLCFLYPN